MTSTRPARSRLKRLSVLTGVLSCAFLSAVATPGMARDINRGVEPIHQPVVSRTDFVFDIAADGGGSLSPAERSRLIAWFDAVDMGFGDRVALADDGGYDYPSLRDAVGSEVGRYGLLLSDEAPRTAGVGAPGTVRVVISRSTARVPGCPDWKDKGENNHHGGSSTNYGCATAGNLAAMVADPQDLIEGRTSRTILRAATSSRAIKVYNEQVPTGKGGLKSESTGGR